MNETMERERTAPAPMTFKMVTFSLGGRDFGIDIMKVKEISYEESFTFVPNVPAHVLGVHNLRGEIIPVIDLRILFHLPLPEKKEVRDESVLILRLAHTKLGVVVDAIDKVLGVPAAEIQPPHPLFGDIAMKYLSGVVESASRLYVILDADRIFSEDADKSEAPEGAAAPAAMAVSRDAAAQASGGREFGFVCETLKTFAGFHVTEWNQSWAENRFQEWTRLRARSGAAAQLQGPEDAREFLKTFPSPYYGALWGDDFREALLSLLPPDAKGSFRVWNQGCGRGHDAYSVVCALKSAHPGLSVKVQACDSNLLFVTTAADLVLEEEAIPASYRGGDLMRKGPKGWGFAPQVRDCIVFEYTEALPEGDAPAFDLIVARDALSYRDPAVQARMLDAFLERLRDGGLLVLGRNETVPPKSWHPLSKGGFTAFRKDSAQEA